MESEVMKRNVKHQGFSPIKTQIDGIVYYA